MYIDAMRKTLQERFDRKWKENPETGCWEWTGGRQPRGYGLVWSCGNMQLAHRVSYELHVGKIPDGLCVCHRCDNRKCVSPEHLFLGTHEDNMRDRNEKGRTSKGDVRWNAKLSSGDADLIRAALDRLPHGGGKFLAQWFGVHETTICDIRRGKSWA